MHFVIAIWTNQVKCRNNERMPMAFGRLTGASVLPVFNTLKKMSKCYEGLLEIRMAVLRNVKID